MPMQIKKELEALIRLESLQFTTKLHNGSLKNFVWLPPSSIHIITVDVTAEVTVYHTVHIDHWKQHKIEPFFEIARVRGVVEQELQHPFHEVR